MRRSPGWRLGRSPGGRRGLWRGSGSSRRTGGGPDRGGRTGGGDSGPDAARGARDRVQLERLRVAPVHRFAAGRALEEARRRRGRAEALARLRPLQAALDVGGEGGRVAGPHLLAAGRTREPPIGDRAIDVRRAGGRGAAAASVAVARHGASARDADPVARRRGLLRPQRVAFVARGLAREHVRLAGRAGPVAGLSAGARGMAAVARRPVGVAERAARAARPVARAGLHGTAACRESGRHEQREVARVRDPPHAGSTAGTSCEFTPSGSRRFSSTYIYSRRHVPSRDAVNSQLK